MPRDGSNTYSKPAGTTAVPNETITSSQFNSTIDDIVTDLNAARPISAGGTGATSASAARTALDVAQKQSSLTDATASRGLLTGGFGIGGVGVSLSDDADNAIYGGIYQSTATTLNTPAGSGPTGCSIIVARYSATTIQQLFLERGSTADDVRVYVRQMREGVWGSWAKVFNSAGEVRMPSDYVANTDTAGAALMATGVLNVGGLASDADGVAAITSSKGGVITFRVNRNGNALNTNNSYGAISDQRKKENITDATPKLADLNELRVVNFTFKGDDLKQLGLIAQEVQVVFPSLVETGQDGFLTVKYSVLVPMLVKAVQELTARVEALE